MKWKLLQSYLLCTFCTYTFPCQKKMAAEKTTWWNNFWIIAPRTFFFFLFLCFTYYDNPRRLILFRKYIYIFSFFFLSTFSSFVADWIMTDRRRCMAAVPCTAWNKRSLVYPGSMHQVSWCQPHPPILADPTNKKENLPSPCNTGRAYMLVPAWATISS